MEREENFKECIKALDNAAESQKKCMIIWFVAAGLMVGLAIFAAVIGCWNKAIMDMVIVAVYVYVAFLHRSKIGDIKMVKESAELIEHIIVSHKEFRDQVEEIFNKAKEAAAKEQESANDVTFEPIK